MLPQEQLGFYVSCNGCSSEADMGLSWGSRLPELTLIRSASPMASMGPGMVSGSGVTAYSTILTQMLLGS